MSCYRRALANLGNRVRVEAEVRTKQLMEAPDSVLSLVMQLVRSSTLFSLFAVRLERCQLAQLLTISWGVFGVYAEAIIQLQLDKVYDVFDEEVKWLSGMAVTAVTSYVHARESTLFDLNQQLYCQWRESMIMFLLEGTEVVCTESGNSGV